MERDRTLRAAVIEVRRRFTPERDGLRGRQAEERAALKDRQSRLLARIFRIVDITGATRRRQEAARKVLSAEHRQQRQELRNRYIAARSQAAASVKTRAAAAINDIARERDERLTEMQARHGEAVRLAEMAWQQREIEREHARQLAEHKIETWRRTRKDAGPLGVESGFAKAMQRAAKKERDRRGRGHGRDRDRDLDRGR